jgi:hypothetical protein
MRKVNDARTVKKELSITYYSEMKGFLNSFKKEAAVARSRRNVDEKSADPISFSFF